MQRAAQADSTRHSEMSSGIAPGITASVPSRRAVFGMGAAGVALTLLPVAAGAAAIPRRWDILRARYEAAVAAADFYNAGPYAKARDRLCTKLGDKPPTSYIIPTSDRKGIEVKIFREGDFPPFPQYDRAREMQLALNAWMTRWLELEKEPWVEGPSTKMDKLYDKEAQAREALMEEPAPDATALAYKVHLALANEEIWANEREAITADAARLSEARDVSY